MYLAASGSIWLPSLMSIVLVVEAEPRGITWAADAARDRASWIILGGLFQNLSCSV